MLRFNIDPSLPDSSLSKYYRRIWKSYSKRNLQNFQKFYQYFLDIDIVNSCVHNLTWTHFRSLLRVSDADARVWYMSEVAHENWNLRPQYQHTVLLPPVVISEKGICYRRLAQSSFLKDSIGGVCQEKARLCRVPIRQ